MSIPGRLPIVLIGFMASGKSTVGRLLAGRLGLPFVDLDARIVERSGRSIPDLFRETGETGFRQLEADALADVLARDGCCVVAGGGGLILRHANRRLLRASAVTVFLDVSFAEIRRRLQHDNAGRPLADASSPERLGELFEDRRSLYLESADLRVTGDGSPDDIVKEIISKATDIASRLEKSVRKS
ncbi:MAG TPA: shikimate kinase [Candidatus Ozemobacteraceae bacterium]|nr:shikimate kinase [Candidatus Ozemobacteraceae bacterium]